MAFIFPMTIEIEANSSPEYNTSSPLFFMVSKKQTLDIAVYITAIHRLLFLFFFAIFTDSGLFRAATGDKRNITAMVNTEILKYVIFSQLQQQLMINITPVVL